MKSFQGKQQVPLHSVYSSTQRPHYLLPNKIISKFNPAKQHQQHGHYPPPSNLSNNLNNGGISEFSSWSWSCYVCKKSFPSSNRLYGHMMRFHPARGMKGVLPPSQAPMMKSVGPPQSQSFFPSESSDKTGMKGLLPPPQAPMKSVGIPSRPHSCSVSESSDITGPDCDPVKLLLSWGKKDRRGKTSADAGATTTASQRNPNETIGGTKTTSNIFTSTSNTLIANQQNPNKRSSSSNSSRTDNDGISWIDNKMTKKYECNICHKEFETGQALGGHKSSSTCRARQGTKLLAPAADDANCQVVMSTMKTKTMMDEIEEGEIIEDGEITDEEGSRRISPKILDFDLNELPPEE
ncbi:hypothetical protein M0R45_026750 [Rubus argutus]|uniref:C2H2-type domain-containing protein n=1 Tax=Rubus argutus TaxID=59490 RepID=A0AAW1WY16_RUBAR